MADNKLAIMSLKVIAAKAEKLAYDLEHNRLWEGQLQQGIEDITRQLRDVESAARSDR